MSEVSNEKLKKFVNAMDDLVELGEELMEDGKIDLGDITSLPKAGSVLSELIEVGKQYKEMLAELKDLDKEEFKELLDAAFDE
jgi:hypothetical protein